MHRLTNHKKDERPWGNFEQFTENELSTVKIITVNAGEAFSLQTHEHRAEFWHMLTGSGKITIGDKVTEVKPGDKFYIDRGTPHRAEGGPEGLSFLEVSIGEFNERDIIRLEDRYGRA